MGRIAKPDSWIERECEKCGKAFKVKADTVRRGYGRYCSVPCARSGSPTRKRNRTTLQCATCGQRFERHVCALAKSVGENAFCSRNCWYQFNQRDNHYLWAGGQDGRMNPEGVAWRKAVIKRDRGHCRICYSRARIEAHHILSFTTHPEVRWDVANGITLCHKCHRQIHRQQPHSPDDVRILQSIAEMRVVTWDEWLDDGPGFDSDPPVTVLPPE